MSEGTARSAEARIAAQIGRWIPGLEKWCGKPMPRHPTPTGEYFVCPECELHAKWHAVAELLDLVQQLSTARAELTQERELLLARMFSEGIDVARSYGDNAFHLWGEQLQRQFALARKRIEDPNHPVRGLAALAPPKGSDV